MVLKNATETRTAAVSIYKLPSTSSENPTMNKDGPSKLFTRYLDVVMIPGKAIQKVQVNEATDRLIKCE